VTTKATTSIAADRGNGIGRAEVRGGLVVGTLQALRLNQFGEISQPGLVEIRIGSSDRVDDDVGDRQECDSTRRGITPKAADTNSLCTGVIDIVVDDTDKGATAASIIAVHQPHRVLAIGDSAADYPMFELADCSVCIGNNQANTPTANMSNHWTLPDTTTLDAAVSLLFQAADGAHWY
jgi:haloacid dehalogenase-like hydrolase